MLGNIWHNAESEGHMEFETIIQFISSVGFPIVMCLVLFKYIEKQHESHKEEISGLNESIGNNTKAVTELSNFIQLLANDVNDIKIELGRKEQGYESNC